MYLSPFYRRFPFGGKCWQRTQCACASCARCFPFVANAGKSKAVWKARASKARHSILGLPGLEKNEEGKKFSICAPFYKCPSVRSSIYLQGESARCVIKLNQRLYVIILLLYCWLQLNLFDMINLAIIHWDEVLNTSFEVSLECFLFRQYNHLCSSIIKIKPNNKKNNLVRIWFNVRCV